MSLLENVIMMQAGDIRELSFQNVVDQILKPNNVKVGGFPETIFLELTESDKESLICNICYFIVNDARQCTNEHLFCRTCVFAWSMTYGENSQKCPFCRVPQTEYEENKKVNRMLENQRVACPEESCAFKAPLKVFLMHGHGKLKYSNSHVDFESIRPPPRPFGANLLVLPNISVSGNNRAERAESIRGQLHQGRLMIHQMMILLHLEMQLRQQALTGFQEATDPYTRIRRLDEVMALNEQLNEVGTVLSTLVNSPINSIISGNRAMRAVSGERDSSDARNSSFRALLEATSSRPDSPRIEEEHSDTEDDAESDSSTFGAALRRSMAENRYLSSNNAATNSSSLSTSVLLGSVNNNRPTSTRNASDSDTVPTIEQGRNLSDYSQATIASSLATDLNSTSPSRGLTGRTPQAPNRLTSRTNLQNNSIRANENESSTTHNPAPSTSSNANAITEETTTVNLSGRTAPPSTQNTRLSVNARNQTVPMLPTVPNPSSSSTTLASNSSTNSSVRASNSIHNNNNENPRNSDGDNQDNSSNSLIPGGSSAFHRARQSIRNSVNAVRSNQGNTRSERSGNTSAETSSTPRPNSVARRVAISSLTSNSTNIVSDTVANLANSTATGSGNNRLNAQQRSSVSVANGTNSSLLRSSNQNNTLLGRQQQTNSNSANQNTNDDTNSVTSTTLIESNSNSTNTTAGRQLNVSSSTNQTRDSGHSSNGRSLTVSTRRNTQSTSSETSGSSTRNLRLTRGANATAAARSTADQTRSNRSRLSSNGAPAVVNRNRPTNRSINISDLNNNEQKRKPPANQSIQSGARSRTQASTSSRGGGTTGSVPKPPPRTSQVGARRSSNTSSSNTGNEPLLRARRRSDIRENLMRE